MAKESIPPPIEDPDYPEILVDMARVTQQALLDKGVPNADARAIARAVAEHLRDYWGGQIVYIGKGRKLLVKQRWQDIWDAFTGDNQADLARRFNVTLQQVYKILEVMKRVEQQKRQTKLFAD